MDTQRKCQLADYDEETGQLVELLWFTKTHFYTILGYLLGHWYRTLLPIIKMNFDMF